MRFGGNLSRKLRRVGFGLMSQEPLDGKILAKRFGLRQAEKIRMIDDCSIGGFNATCGVNEKMRVHSVDEMAAYICWCMTHLGKGAMSQVVGKRTT